MDQFNIIGQLELYALSQGWHFIYGFDNFESNAMTIRQFTQGEYVLIADFKAEPKYSLTKIQEIRYTCLLMLGRKHDSIGYMSSLDETAIQKYDRRLKELCILLAATISTFACSNGLEIISAPISVNINVFDQNIDFAISENAIFLQ